MRARGRGKKGPRPSLKFRAYCAEFVAGLIHTSCPFRGYHLVQTGSGRFHEPQLRRNKVRQAPYKRALPLAKQAKRMTIKQRQRANAWNEQQLAEHSFH